MPAENQLLTLEEAAALLRVKVSTLRAWKLQRRNLVFRKIGHSIRVRRQDVETLIDRSAQEPQQADKKTAGKGGAK